MIVGHRSVSLQSSRTPSQVGVTEGSRRNLAPRPMHTSNRPMRTANPPELCRAQHEPLYPARDEGPLDRVERHFDDRDRMFPAADLLRLVGRHKHDPANKHLLPWMLRVETSLEFMADLDHEAADADTEEERQAATRGALKNAHGIRQLLDAFDPFLADAPEIFEDTLQAADAAFDRRIHELARLSRRAPRPAQARPPRAGSLLPGFAQLWCRLQEEVERNVEWRKNPPPSDYHSLDFIKNRTDDHR